jgi:hypothetical protein
MKTLIRIGMVVGALFLLGFSLSTAMGQTQGPAQDQWRYVLHNGQWWYWLPEGRWIYWQENQWKSYFPSAPTGRSTLAYPYYAPTSSYSDSQVSNDDIQPFYGHAMSQPGYGRYYEDDIGPFYGHVVPNGPLGSGPAVDLSIRPFYGHAASSLR